MSALDRKQTYAHYAGGSVAADRASTLPMRTPWPAARAALTFTEALAAPVNALRAGFRLFCRANPADPFVSCERGNVMPRCQGRRVARQRAPKVDRKFMDDPTGYTIVIDHAALNTKATKSAMVRKQTYSK